VSLRHRLRTLFCCTILQIGVLLGAPMPPEEIQELMRSLGGAKVARTTPSEADKGDGSKPGRTP